MAACAWLYEKRPLKKPKLGPPDVYPQEPKQKEDELTVTNVKQGFACTPQLAEEYGTARNCNITPAQFRAFFSAILTKKQELNTFQESTRRRQQINTKDNFWPVTARSKNSLDAWFKDLAGSKTLSSLAKKVPISNKKEEIFVTLNEFSVPMIRAAWFIKMTSAHAVAISEAKIKKRQHPDPSQEWTQAICKFLRDLLQKMFDPSSNSASFTSMCGVATPTTPEALNKQWRYCTALAFHLYEEGLLDKQDFLSWILDLFEKSKASDDPMLKLILPLTLQYLDEFVNSEVLSRRLAYYAAKKLNQLISDPPVPTPPPPPPPPPPQPPSNPAQQQPAVPSSQANGTSNALVPSSNNNNNNTNPQNTTPAPAPLNPMTAGIMDMLNCSFHRSLILCFSAILQAITLDCPGALVWNNLGEGRSHSILHASPLDILPCAPSCLPMPPSRSSNNQIRTELAQAEQHIRERGIAAESKWSSDKLHQSAAGVTIQKILNALDALDRHCFDKVDAVHCLDTLYAKIFPATSTLADPIGGSTPGTETILAEEEPIVNLLCEWAVTTRRTGEYRALVVARLLEKRQNDLIAAEKSSENDVGDEKDSQDSNGPLGLPLYQNLLVSFLDNKAPVLDEKSTLENKQAFSNLVLLFSELIRQEVFSHDAYMCTLISRGSFASLQGGLSGLPGVLPGALATAPPAPTKHVISDPPLTGFMMDPTPQVGCLPPIPVLPSSEPPIPPHARPHDVLPMFEPPDHHSSAMKPEVSWDVAGDMDDARLDADLENILQHIKEGQQQNMSDPPDSVGSDKDDGLEAAPVGNTSGGSSGSGNVSQQCSNLRRHLQYTTHFPLPLEELGGSSGGGGTGSSSGGGHDSNQRHILLYGVGRARDDARHLVKKVTKEILKLFGKKTSMDVSEGCKVKKHAREALSLDTVVSRFQNLSYFDQHVVAHGCASHVVDMLGAFTSGSSNYLPLVEHVAFLMELMESALYLQGLLEFAIQLLRELPDVETQLASKGSSIAGTYATSIGLYIVGELYRYHCCLLVSQELTSTVFEGLCKLIKQVLNPSCCSSAERCIFSYLYDLYTSCNFLKLKHSDIFGPLYQKLNQALFQTLTPSALNQRWNSSFMLDNINNPKARVEPHLIKELNENPVSRYSFICNAVIKIYEAKDADRLNDISLLCAELTANCQTLPAEWLGVLKAICNSSNHGCGFIDVLTHIDESDFSIYDNLAVFTSILIARRCFSLENFIVHVAMPSLMASLGGGRSNNAQPGSRLTCHLLMRLYKMGEPSPPLGGAAMAAAPGQRSLYYIRNACDRHLLAAAHSSSVIQAIIAVLKAVIMLAHSSGGAAGESGKGRDLGSHNKGELAISDLLGTLDDPNFDISGSGSQPSAAMGMETDLTDFAKHSLRQMCSQEWVHERCLRDPDVVCSPDVLLDPMLSNRRAQQLLQMICHPKGPDPLSSHDEGPDQKQSITTILQNLDMWTLRVSLLELQLMYKQCAKGSKEDVNPWLENVAKLTVQHLTSDLRQGSGNRVWLVAPLIAKLPSAVQGKVLKAAAQVLESGAWAPPTFSNSSSSSSSSSLAAAAAKNKEKENPTAKPAHKSASSSTHQPFLSLVLMCLKGQDEQREGLLTSLNNQISQFLHPARDDKLSAEVVHAMQEPLRLRLSLLGGMFDMVQRSNTLTLDWACLLVQLVTYEIVDPRTNAELFSTVLDMLAVLVHTAQVPEASSNSGEETRKHYLNLVKKLKKELPDRTTDATRLVKQLLPLSKQQCEVIRCEPTGSLIDTKGNKIAGFDSIEKKQGLQVAQKQIVIPWDLLEGHKNPTPFSWTWFGAVKIEKKPLRQDETHRLLLWHTHDMMKPNSYFYEPPMLPQDDLEPLPEKAPAHQYFSMVPMDESLKRGRETPLDHSPRGYPKKAKRATNKRRNAKMIAGQQPPGPPIRPGLPYPPDQMTYPPQNPSQNWGYGQNSYYPQQPPVPTSTNAGPPRFEPRAPMSQSKAALSSMLRARHPSTPQFQGPSSGYPGPAPPTMEMKRHMMMRQIRPPQGHMPPHPSQQQQGGMYPPPPHSGAGAPMGGPQGAQGTAPLHHLPPPPQSTQSYGNYSGGSMLEARSAPMSGNAPYPGGHPGMMPPQYMANRPQYPPMTQQGGAGGSGHLQPPPTAGPPYPQSNMPPSIQQQQQLRHQQHMLAMQKQQQQQQQHHQAAAIVAQLQRHVNPAQQHHQYHQNY